MTEQQLKRAKEIQKDLRRLDRVLCFTDPEKTVSISLADDNKVALKELCLRNEYDICNILMKYKRKLEKELSEL